MDKKKLATILGYLGLIPFFSLTVIYFISNFNNYVVDVYLFFLIRFVASTLFFIFRDKN